MTQENEIPALATPLARGPSARALQVLTYMREFFAENDQLPPAAIISGHFGWASASAADCHIAALLRHQLVERNAVGKLRFARLAPRSPREGSAR